MILYENSVENFIKAAGERTIIGFFSNEYEDHFSRKTDSRSLIQWKYSIQVIKDLILEARISNDTGIRIDYVITCNYKWFEIILAARVDNVIRTHIIELLPFEYLKVKKSDELYCFLTNEEKIEFIHPSRQSICYKEYIKANLQTISSERIEISSSVYLYECRDESTRSAIIGEVDLLQEAPVFFCGDNNKLYERISCFENAKGGKDALQIFHARDQLCSAGMDSYIDKLFNSRTPNNGLYTEQRHVAASVVASVKNQESNLFILNGMAGTGKTAVAIAIMKELKDEGYKVLFLNGTLATSDAMTNRIKQYTCEAYEIKTIQNFVHEENWEEYDAVILDEAQNTGYFFIHEYMNVVKKLPKTILFLCSMIQCISEKEFDFIDSINKKAVQIGVNITSFDLNSNIRFSGQASGINWLVHQLQIADTGNYEDWDVDSYKIRILDKPDDITKTIAEEQNNGNLCRALVRYDTIESISRKYGTPAFGYDEDQFMMPVITAKSPYASRWYKDESLAQYAVGTRLVQGMELDYACVVIDDLTYDKAYGIILKTEKVEYDLKNFLIQRVDHQNGIDKDVIAKYMKMVLNSYYIALSRGKKGAYIYARDEKLRQYLKEKVCYANRRYSWIKDFLSQYDYDSEKGIIRRNVRETYERSDQYAYVTLIYEKFNSFIEGIKGQLKGAIDEQSYKAICDQCSALLLDLQKDAIEDENFSNIYEGKIIENMGESAWNKLSSLSQKCLLSAEIIFHDLKDYNQLLDFSGVCVQVAKAVEYELSDRYLKKYIEYLRKKYKNKIMDSIPRELLDNHGNLKTVDTYTLGDVRYTLGMDSKGNVKNWGVYKEFEEYARACLVIDTKNVQSVLGEHIRIIHKIKNDYRNKAAHKASIDVIAAQDCINYVIEIERKLRCILDAYKH